MGRLSAAMLPGVSLQVWKEVSHLSAAVSWLALGAKLLFQSVLQPASFGLFGFLPAPEAVMACE